MNNMVSRLSIFKQKMVLLVDIFLDLTIINCSYVENQLSRILNEITHFYGLNSRMIPFILSIGASVLIPVGLK